MQNVIHYSLHFALPFFVAVLFYPRKPIRTYLILLATMLVDADHLLANPIFDPNRCSVGFHPLHSYVAIGIYLLLLLPARSRVVAIGLLMHMGTDLLDCYLGHHL